MQNDLNGKEISPYGIIEVLPHREEWVKTDSKTTGYPTY